MWVVHWCYPVLWLITTIKDFTFILSSLACSNLTIMLSYALESNGKQVFLIVKEGSLMLNSAKINNLQRCVDHNGVLDVPLLVFLKQILGRFLLWLLELSIGRCPTLLFGCCQLIDHA